MFENTMQNIVSRVLEQMSKTEQSKMLPMINNFSWMLMWEIAERAKNGKPLYEPEGTTRKNYMDFRDMVFIPAQLKKLPLDREANVDTTVKIGMNVKKPLEIAIPLMITGMGYGVSVSMEIKKAMAKAAKLSNTAVNSGEAGFIPEERELTDKYIVQFNRAGWGNSQEQLRMADMIEVKVGQGAAGSDGFEVKQQEAGEHFLKHLGLKLGQDGMCPNKFPQVNSPNDWKKLVDSIREINPDVPVVVKIGAGDLEGDIDIALDAGFDGIVIDGGGGGTAYSLEITINNFCLPLVYAISKANNYLIKKKARENISLIAAGGAHSPGDFLKAMALGADAIYVGQPCLLAMTYFQFDKMPTGTNPTQMFLYSGKFTDKLDIDESAQHLSNFLKASAQEMQMSSRILGKSALRDVNKDDLLALKSDVADVTGLRLANNNL